VPDFAPEEHAAVLPSIVGVTRGDPFDPRTFSSCSAPFFRALERNGALYAAVSSTPSSHVTLLNQLATFTPSPVEWRSRFHGSAGYRDANSRAARERIARLDPSAFDTVLQIGAMFDATDLPGKLTVSYHDSHFIENARSEFHRRQVPRRTADAIIAFERGFYERSRMLFTMSKFAADSFMRTYGLPASKVEPVGAGSNLPFAGPQFTRTNWTPEILFVGFDFVRKGGPTLLAAFERVRRAIPDATLTIVGPKTIGAVPPGVRFVGRISRADPHGDSVLLSLFRRAAVFAMPSQVEPFGFVFLEAMSQKLPCIGADTCAMPEIIEHGSTGFVVPVGDAHTLADRLIEILGDEESARQMGERGYARAVERYTWDGTAARITERVSDLL
jgi:glycosyltransferase involved in cell wall biosynthesis